MRQLKILVLHSLGDPRTAPLFLHQHVHALRNHAPQHAYTYHDTTRDAAQAIAHERFDAVVLDVTFLCARWSGEENYAAIRRDYAFIAALDAVKLAFPQDEYDCNELLDDWLCDWGVDVVFSVIDGHHDVLYPRYSRRGSIRLGYTGYIDESLLALRPAPWRSRPIDIGYRSKKLPPYFGRIGETKWRIGERVNRLCRATELVADILVGDAAALNGTAWLEFINSCRFTLGANSGSSLLDPRGEIQRNVRAYLAAHPDAAFEEVERRFFPGQDERHRFTAISPRVLEAGVLGSCQILVEGDYSGLIRPWEHYIPIRADAADFDRVHEAMRDHAACLRMARACRDALLSNPALRYRNHATRTLRVIDELLQARVPGHVALPLPLEVVPEPGDGALDAGPDDARQGSRSVLMLSTCPIADDPRLAALAGIAPPQLEIRCVEACPAARDDAAREPDIAGASGSLQADVQQLRALAAMSDAELFLALGGSDHARVRPFRLQLVRLLRDAAVLLRRAREHAGVQVLLATDRASLLAGAILRQSWRIPLMYDAGGDFSPATDGVADPFEARVWSLLERRLVAHVDYAQTVSLPQASRLTRETGTHFTAVPGTLARCEAAVVAIRESSQDACRFGIDARTAERAEIEGWLRVWATTDSHALLEIRVSEASERDALLQLATAVGLHAPRLRVVVRATSAREASTGDDVTLIGGREGGVAVDAVRLRLLSQALAHGAPVIAVRHAALSALLLEYDAGVLVDARAIDAAGAIIDAWTRNATQRAHHAAGARACFDAAFHWEIDARLGYARLRGLADNGLSATLGGAADAEPWPVVHVPAAVLWRFRARRAVFVCGRSLWHCLPWAWRQALIPLIRRGARG